MALRNASGRLGRNQKRFDSHGARPEVVALRVVTDEDHIPRWGTDRVEVRHIDARMRLAESVTDRPLEKSESVTR